MATVQERYESLKKELIPQYILSYQEQHWCDSDYDEKLAVPYAEKCFEDYMKHFGPDRMFKCKEECDGVYLMEHLDKIRNLNEQACLLLAVQYHCVVGEIIFFSESGMITHDDYENDRIFDIIKSWHEKGYDVLSYFNHPNSIAAKPIYTDIGQLDLKTTNNPNIQRMLKEAGLSDFEYYDWGIVTEFDFYSERQEKKSKELLEEDLARMGVR